MGLFELLQSSFDSAENQPISDQPITEEQSDDVINQDQSTTSSDDTEHQYDIIQDANGQSIVYSGRSDGGNVGFVKIRNKFHLYLYM